MGHIRDDMITASSSRDGNVNPKNARLYSSSAWVANTNDKNQYLQVKLFSYLLIEYSYFLHITYFYTNCTFLVHLLMLLEVIL